MSLTDSEILELEKLLQDREISNLKKGLTVYSKQTNPNYSFLKDAITNQAYKGNEITAGFRGCILEGSSRSGKTWSGVDIIIWLCTEVETNCTINIFRETYTEFKETLYEDFKKRLDDFNLPNPFHNAKEIKSFKIGKNKIAFLGCDKIGSKHGAGCDYAFYNEMIHIPEPVFNQSEMRCRKFWWGDYNPSVTEHYIFNSVITRPDVGFLRTTFLDNPFISVQEKNKILSYEPWMPNSYEVSEADILYNGKIVDEKNQPPPHPTNLTNGTADEFMWKVYGLGLRGAMKGVIFPHVVWIDKFPDIGYIYANDFGFTTDPNAFVRYAEDELNIYIEPLIYTPIETPETLANTFEALGVEKDIPIACDSSDKYTGENKGTVEMVRGLQELGYIEAFKISKTNSVMFWLGSMKNKRIHIVKNHLYQQVKKEQENYRMKEINGIAINQPIDKWNHFFDGSRYGHIAWNNNVELETEWS